MRVLFVCTGNTCRSPMAECLLKAKVWNESRQNEIFIGSAGIAALDGQGASDYAGQAMRLRGLSLASHRAHLLTVADLQAADLILTMTGRHKAAIVEAFSPAGQKIYTLAEYSGHAEEVVDPFGRDLAAYAACAALLEQQILDLWEDLKNGKVEAKAE